MGPILGKLIPGAAGLDHPEIANAGHFVQEDAAAQLVEVVVQFVNATPAV